MRVSALLCAAAFLLSLAGCVATSSVPPDPANAAEVAAAVYDTVNPSNGMITLAGPSIGRPRFPNGVFELRYVIAPGRRGYEGPFLHVTVFRPAGGAVMAIHPSSATAPDDSTLRIVRTETADSGDGIFESTVVLLPPDFLTSTRHTGTVIQLHGSGTFACAVPAFYIDGFIVGATRILRELRLDGVRPKPAVD